VALEEFVQTSLYVGLVSQSLRVDLQPNDFRRVNQEGTVVLCSASLVSLMGRWSSALCELNKGDISTRLHEAGAYWRCTEWLLGRHLDPGQVQDSDRLCRIYLAVIVLGESLGQALRDVAYHNKIEFHVEVSWRSAGIGCSQAICQAMLENGWCSSRLRPIDSPARCLRA